MTTFVAPVLRTAVTRLCIPATCQVPRRLPELALQPSRQHVHDTPVGSLNRSKMVAGSALKAVATWLQKVGE